MATGTKVPLRDAVGRGAAQRGAAQRGAAHGAPPSGALPCRGVMPELGQTTASLLRGKQKAVGAGRSVFPDDPSARRVAGHDAGAERAAAESSSIIQAPRRAFIRGGPRTCHTRQVPATRIRHAHPSLGARRVMRHSVSWIVRYRRIADASDPQPPAGPGFRPRRDRRHAARPGGGLRRRRDRPARRHDRPRQRLPDGPLAKIRRPRRAGDHRRGGIRRRRHGLPGACRGDGGDFPRLGLGRPVVRRALQPLRQPDPPQRHARRRSAATCPG